MYEGETCCHLFRPFLLLRLLLGMSLLCVCVGEGGRGGHQKQHCFCRPTQHSPPSYISAIYVVLAVLCQEGAIYCRSMYSLQAFYGVTADLSAFMEVFCYVKLFDRKLKCLSFLNEVVNLTPLLSVYLFRTNDTAAQPALSLFSYFCISNRY